MEQFHPNITIVSVEPTQIAVMFDSCAAFDSARSPKTVIFPRQFKELRVAVTGFLDKPESDIWKQKEFSGEIKLVVTTGDGEVEFTLAQPELWIASTGQERKGDRPFIFPSAHDVMMAVRQGTAAALARALDEFLGRESDFSGYHRASGLYKGQDSTMVKAAAHNTGESYWAIGAIPRLLRSRGARASANDAGDSGNKQYRKRLIVAAVVSPVLVFVICAVVGRFWSKDDPIHAAVAQEITQSAPSMQAQVELTKETLKQMGLDPGKSGDVGCLAPQ